MIVEIEIGRARFCGIDTGKKIKTEPFPKQFFLGGLGLVFGIELFQDPIVFPKPIVGVPYNVFFVLVQQIVPHIAAIVAAKHFICAPLDFVPTFWTDPFHKLKIGYFLNFPILWILNAVISIGKSQIIGIL